MGQDRENEPFEPVPGAKIINLKKRNSSLWQTRLVIVVLLSPNNFIWFLPSGGLSFGWATELQTGVWDFPWPQLTRCHQGVIIRTNGSQWITLYHRYHNDPTFPASYDLTPGHQLIFMTLSGLLLGSSLGFPYALDRTPATCIAVRVGTGISYVLIYSSLLVKLVFLLSLNIGVYLPAMYQALLFFFCVLVQAVITAQWNILKVNIYTIQWIFYWLNFKFREHLQ